MLIVSRSNQNRRGEKGRGEIGGVYLSRESGEEDQSATGLLLRTHSAGPVSQTCYYL
jgi:hypothetical protein